MGVIKVITDAVKDYESEQKQTIESLNRKIKMLETERSLIIKHLKNNNIKLLKDYFLI